jgi:hypothetical protein
MVKGPTELAFLVAAIVYEVVMIFSFRLNTASEPPPVAPPPIEPQLPALYPSKVDSVELYRIMPDTAWSVIVVDATV